MRGSPTRFANMPIKELMVRDPLGQDVDERVMIYVVEAIFDVSFTKPTHRMLSTKIL
jgi:hypothetical protein